MKIVFMSAHNELLNKWILYGRMGKFLKIYMRSHKSAGAGE